MRVPLALAARAALAVSAWIYRQHNGHRSSAVLFQSLVSEFCFMFKCPLAELPAFQICHTLAVTGRNSPYVLICTHTHHKCNGYMYGLLRPNYV